MKPNIGKRLFQYALTSKAGFIAALIALAIGVAAELAGPFIAKTMIDDHMLAIEKPFYEPTDRKAHLLNSSSRFGICSPVSGLTKHK
ncbi:hypothetical protein E4V51_19355 [Paenibacillus sp. 28ISP30-2]|nr:hypothetical protein [Paenibacillus sp. 28ISP30-2]